MTVLSCLRVVDKNALSQKSTRRVRFGGLLTSGSALVFEAGVNAFFVLCTLPSRRAAFMYTVKQMLCCAECVKWCTTWWRGGSSIVSI